MKSIPTVPSAINAKNSPSFSVVSSKLSKETSNEASAMQQISTWKKTLKASVCTMPL